MQYDFATGTICATALVVCGAVVYGWIETERIRRYSDLDASREEWMGRLRLLEIKTNELIAHMNAIGVRVAKQQHTPPSGTPTLRMPKSLP